MSEIEKSLLKIANLTTIETMIISKLNPTCPKEHFGKNKMLKERKILDFHRTLRASLWFSLSILLTAPNFSTISSSVDYYYHLFRSISSCKTA